MHLNTLYIYFGTFSTPYIVYNHNTNSLSFRVNLESIFRMSLLSSSVSLTRYKVHGKVEPPILNTVARGLKNHTISEIDENVSEKVVGWTSLEDPFRPDFDGSSFVYGDNFIFSLRIDKKNIPPKVIKKHCSIESTKRMAESGRDYLSKTEKQIVKDHVIHTLSL